MNQFGVPVLTLSDLVSNFNLEQGNMQERYFLKNLAHAKWVWKELFLRSLWEMRQVVLQVRSDNTIKLPNDMQGQVNITVVDRHGNKQQIGYNPNMNTVEILCPTNSCKCSCKGVDTLCASFDSMSMSTEQIELKGEMYTKTTWVKNIGCGEIVEYTKTPVWDAESEAVIYIDGQTTLGTMEVTSTGCIKATEENRQRFRSWCGCYVALPYRDVWNWDCRPKYDVSPMDSNYGEWNWNAAAGDIIHLKHVNADKVIVGIQSSGEVSGQEIVVPEYALTAMQFGIIHRQVAFRPGSSDSEKRSARREYNIEKTALNQFLRPINMKVVMDLQTGIPLW